LAEVRAELEETQLRAYLLEHPQDRTGDEHVAVVGSQSRKRIDLKALADEIGASVGPTIKPAPAVKSERPGTPNNISDCARNVQRAGGRSRKFKVPHRRGARCLKRRILHQHQRVRDFGVSDPHKADVLRTSDNRH
jgi:hypothetical protein